MAKKKGKKAQAQKQPELASPPHTPKTVPEEPVPAVPASLPLSPETAPADSIPDDSAPALDPQTEAKTEEPPALDDTSEPVVQEAVVEEPSAIEHGEEASVPQEEEKAAEDPDFDVSAWTSEDPAKESEQEPTEAVDPEATVEEPIPEVQTEQVLETPIEEPVKSEPAPPPADDDWGSFAGLSSKKKKKGKKGKKEPEIEQPTIEAPEPPPVVEAPEPPSVVEAPEPPSVLEAPEPPSAAEATETHPIVEAPEAPVVEVPEAPVVEAPEAPVVEAPEAPSVVEAAEPPSVTEASESSPVLEAPEPTPVTEAPEPAPLVEAPEAPEASSALEPPESAIIAEVAEPTPVEVKDTKAEEPAVDDWAVPAKSSKKKGKKGKKGVVTEPPKVEKSVPIATAPEPPVVEAPEPPVVEAPEPPVVEAPEPPAVEAPEPPVVEAPEPPVEAPEPPVEAPEPPVEAPEPPIEATEPPVEAPEPPVEAPEPPIEATEPPVEAPEPPVEAPEPPIEATEPPVEAPEPPVVEAPEPSVVEVPEPPVAEPPPAKKKGKKNKKVKVAETPVIIEAPEPPVTESPEPPSVVSEPPSTPAEHTQQDTANGPAAEQSLEPVKAKESIPEPTRVNEVPPEPPKEQERPPEPEKAREPAVEDQAPPTKSSKKKGKKGNKGKDQSSTSIPVEASAQPEPIIEAQSGASVETVPQPEAIKGEKNSAQATEPEPDSTSEPAIAVAPKVPEPLSVPETSSVTEEAARPTAVVAALPRSAPVLAQEPPVSRHRAPSPPATETEARPLPASASSGPAPPPRIASPVPTPRAVSHAPPLAPEYTPNYPNPTLAERPPISFASSKPEAVNQVIEDDRPPAPTPPVTRARPRRAPIYDDDDEDDSAIIEPRLRNDALSRDSSRGSYPPAHSRSLFASRVPPPERYSSPPQPDHYSHPPQPEHYSHPPPPPAPPQYHHPRHHYPPSAPPYYHEPSHPSSHAPTHSMSQTNGYSDYAPYGSHSHGSSPHGYQESWSQMPPNYGYHGHSPPQRHDPMRSRGYPSGGLPAIENGPSMDDGMGDAFFSRMSHLASAIPDLHALLAKYKELQNQLAVREELHRHASAENHERLRAKDDEIQSMRDRISSMERKHSTEASRLRLEVGNMEEQVKDLKDRLTEAERFKVEAGQLSVTLDTTTKYWEGKYKELEEAHTSLGKTSSEELARTRVEFEEWKSTTNTRNDAEKIALVVQLDKKLKEAEDAAENLRQEASATHIKEKDDLRSEHQRQMREREESFDRLRTELEHKLSTSQLDCEQALKRERETMEVWAKERATLVQAHREDVESLRKSWEEQRSLLEGQHKRIKDESDKAWIELHAEATRKADESKAFAEQLGKEKEELFKHYNELKLEHEKEKQIIKSVATNLESEKSRLEKLMESFGDIAEIKSKGDTYYLVSFTQLQKQILDLAATHFVHLPVVPPPEELQQIPSYIPSFLADTPSSRRLRAAYVAHTVSKLVTYRVFGPFLFSLGRRYDKADSLFLSMSNHIRDKSTRKEAIWRQQTLLAAFTSSGAKQRINTAAGTVVEEIVNAIKHFADPKEEEGIKIAVKRIVKLAAETWRFARLEREMICATMPSIDDNEHDFTGTDYWASHRPEGSPIASLVGTEMSPDEKPKMLLRLFPVIYREPKHENFRDESENDKPDEGCIYHHGLALYDDAEPVVARREELQAAGLPPTTNAASPIAADFPPSLLPAPRTSLPPTPIVGNSVRSKSPSLPSDPPKDEYRVPIRPSSPASLRSDKTSIRSRTPPPVPPKRTSIRSRSSLSVKSDKRSSRSSAAPPPPQRAPPPPPTHSSEASSSRKSAALDPSHANYTRPPPGPIDFDTPRDMLPAATESILGVPPASLLVPAASYGDTQAPKPSAETPKVDAATPEDQTPPLASTESAIIPPFNPSASDLPTPPHSRTPTPADGPVSPLFAALDEIDALSSHRSRRTSSSRRSARSKPSQEELHQDDSISMKKTRSKSRHKHDDKEEDRPDSAHSARRTSGYTLNSRTSGETERPGSGRNSFYMCESRSAAIKGLYPNSPLAGQSPQLSRTNSLKSRRKSGSIHEEAAGTWDATTAADPATEGDEGTKE